MNLLVTNTRAAQAYFIIRALRSQAEKIVVTMYGESSVRARLASHAAASRLVDKRYHVPSPAGDWKRGKLEGENGAGEEAYIQRLLQICEAERIDTIFPSWDAQIFLLAKHKPRFERLGILIPVPDFATLAVPLDKYRVLQAAQEAGLVCPRTRVPTGPADIEPIADELGFPIVIKPRYASWGIEMAENRPSLLEKARRVTEAHGTPMLQEYIPPGERQDLHFVFDRSGAAKLMISRTAHRSLRLDPHAHFATVHELTRPYPYAPQAMRLAQMLGWWGSATVETAVDPRDGRAKFMEFVPRFRRQLWNTTELGINEPSMCLKIARGEAVESVGACPLGAMFLSPMEDALLLAFQFVDRCAYRFRTGVLGKPSLDPWNRPPSLQELWHSFKRAYLGPNRKIIDPYFRYFFHDPLVALLWWIQMVSWMAGLGRKLGR